MNVYRNSLVRIGNGKKVYRVSACSTIISVPVFLLDANAEHPDAAKRVPDALKWYREYELSPVND